MPHYNVAAPEPFIVLGALTLVTGVVLAVWVLRTNPHRKENIRLTMVLGLSAVAYGYWGGLVLLLDASGEAIGRRVIALVEVVTPGAYLYLLALVPTPLSRALRRPAVAWPLLAMFLALFLAIVVISDVVHRALAYNLIVNLPTVLVGFFGLAVSIWWYRTAVHGAARHQARAYFWAFGVRDVALILGYGFILSGLFPRIDSLWFAAIGLGGLVPSLFLVYGAMRNQLFDLDLKLKLTLSRGTVASSFVAVFFVSSELAADMFTKQLGLVVGLLAAGGLVLVFSPLQRFAEHFADRAMPGVQDSEEYRNVRKREVYAAALASAFEDGEITEKERSILATLADQLGIGGHEALTMERTAGAARPGPGAGMDIASPA